MLPEDARLSASAVPGLVDVRVRVHTIRGVQVMLDADLAALYGVSTARLMQQVRRNRLRFPPDFAFQLEPEETRILMLQNATSNLRHGGRRKLPHAFTEQGVAMLSGVLRSERAIAVNIEIMRAFVALRRMAAADAEFARRIAELERELRQRLGEHDEALAAIFAALHALSEPAAKPRRPVGFAAEPGAG